MNKTRLIEAFCNAVLDISDTLKEMVECVLIVAAIAVIFVASFCAIFVSIFIVSFSVVYEPIFAIPVLLLGILCLKTAIHYRKDYHTSIRY